MPTFNLDGRAIPFEKGDTIIRAAHRAGIDIPHYCWHPGLSVAANCRMCLVEILPPPGQRALMLDVLFWDAKAQDYVAVQKPKLQPACQTAAAENLCVKSETSAEAIKARKQVQELLLLNHPVDCPICDQAGECRLQDYWLEHQHEKKRMKDEILHKPKAVVFGKTIVYDAERCILCTRCVRFCEEVAKDPVLCERDRGNLTEIALAPGRELDDDYTLMTEFVCPVGALTSKDFRFRQRVWFLASAKTLCIGCATGCSALLDFDPRTMTPYRYRPRETLAVNTYWMCDEGMLSYRRILDGRILEPRVGGERVKVEVALAKATELFAGVPKEKVAVVLSAEHSCEDNFALLELARTYIGTNTLFVSGRPVGKGDDILMHEDKNPNTAGVNKLAAQAKPLCEMGTGFTHVLSLGAETVDGAAPTGRQIVAVASHDGPLTRAAAVVLPACTWAEAAGTYVNSRGMTQTSERALAPRGQALPAWAWIARLGQALGYATTWSKLDHLRNAMERGAPVLGAPAGA
jgi:NADH-quinone oxidoreductase subunit G